jgi:hypothetical protein
MIGWYLVLKRPFRYYDGRKGSANVLASKEAFGAQVGTKEIAKEQTHNNEKVIKQYYLRPESNLNFQCSEALNIFKKADSVGLLREKTSKTFSTAKAKIAKAKLLAAQNQIKTEKKAPSKKKILTKQKLG